MLVVLPYCAHDFELASQLLDYLPPLGPYTEHSLTLLRAPGVPDLQEKAKKSFGAVQCLEVLGAPDGWPRGPNAMFAAAVRVAGQPFYFLEPDSTPTRAGWLGALETEYALAGKSFMGAVVPTRIMRKGTEVIDGLHMMGSGIYPADVAAHCDLFSTVAATQYPFDCYLRWQVIPHCHPTKLIQHAWNTCDARRRRKNITVRPVNKIAHGATIRENAVVVHGVKGGSLMRLLQQEAV